MHYTPCNFIAEFDELFDGRVATGQHAVGIGSAIKPIELVDPALEKMTQNTGSPGPEAADSQSATRIIDSDDEEREKQQLDDDEKLPWSDSDGEGQPQEIQTLQTPAPTRKSTQLPSNKASSSLSTNNKKRKLSALESKPLEDLNPRRRHKKTGGQFMASAIDGLVAEMHKSRKLREDELDEVREDRRQRIKELPQTHVEEAIAMVSEKFKDDLDYVIQATAVFEEAHKAHMYIRMPDAIRGRWLREQIDKKLHQG